MAALPARSHPTAALQLYLPPALRLDEAEFTAFLQVQFASNVCGSIPPPPLYALCARGASSPPISAGLWAGKIQCVTATYLPASPHRRRTPCCTFWPRAPAARSWRQVPHVFGSRWHSHLTCHPHCAGASFPTQSALSCHSRLRDPHPAPRPPLAPPRRATLPQAIQARATATMEAAFVTAQEEAAAEGPWPEAGGFPAASRTGSFGPRRRGSVSAGRTTSGGGGEAVMMAHNPMAGLRRTSTGGSGGGAAGGGRARSLDVELGARQRSS